jgi:hypothetical protein
VVDLVQEWNDREILVPLTLLDSPYRDITRPVLEYLARLRSDRPRELIAVFLPEYLVSHWWEALLHNQSALRLKARLLFQPGVMMVSVPWQLAAHDNGQSSGHDNGQPPLNGRSHHLAEVTSKGPA